MVVVEGERRGEREKRERKERERKRREERGERRREEGCLLLVPGLCSLLGFARLRSQCEGGLSF